ncbi:hypothetical protein L195_g062007, partial [Trifolium pratense]
MVVNASVAQMVDSGNSDAILEHVTIIARAGVVGNMITNLVAQLTPDNIGATNIALMRAQFELNRMNREIAGLQQRIAIENAALIAANERR